MIRARRQELRSGKAADIETEEGSGKWLKLNREGARMDANQGTE
jgi:hypothetical protein